MALTRKMLKAMSIEDDKVDQIIEAHTETTDALKAERDGFKDKAGQYDAIKKELDTLKANPGEDWKEKHDKVKKEFDDYKADLTKKETLAAKKKAFTALVDGIGIKDPAIKELAILKANFDEINLDGDKIKEADALTESLKNDYADYIETDGEKGARVEHPPKNNNSVKTKEEIYKMENGKYVLSATERQAELAKLISQKGS